MTHAIPAALRFLGLLTLILGLAQAAPPSTINYQGYLTNAGGTPVTNPAVAMSFSLFTAPSGGSPLWSETQSVAVTGGVFNVVLGTGSLVGGSPLGSLAFDVPYYLEFTAGGETLSPRTALTSSPYAFRASNLASGATVEGVVPPGYMILGTTNVSPPGFEFLGMMGSYYLHVRQGTAGQAIQTSGPALTVTEGSTGQFNVTLAMAPPSNVTVLVNSFNTEQATVSPPSLTFSPANSSTPQPVTVTGVEDVNLSNDEVIVSLGAAGLPTVQVYVTVNDNDAQSIIRSTSFLGVTEGSTNTFTVNLGYQPASSVTVNVASGDTTAATVSPSILTFTTADWDTPKNVTVTGVQDVDIVNESVTVTLSSAGLASVSVTANVNDDDTQAIVRSTPILSVAEGGTNTFGVNLAYMPPSTTTVNVASSDTAAATVSPSFLTFTTADWDTPKNVTVTGVQDANNTNESVTVTLSSAGLASPTVNATVTDDDLIIESLGWPNAFGGSQSISPGAVVAYLVNVPVATTIDKFGLIAAAGGADFRMALYTDAAGTPGTLEHSMPAQTISAAGVQENNITDGAVSAGNHWLAIRVSPSASINYDAATLTNRCVRSVSIPVLDDPWPATYGTSSCAAAGTFNLYMITYR